MKDQASLNLLIVDSPIDTKALENHLMLRATSSGLKVYDATGSETELGGGGGGETTWDAITGKPESFTPSAHTHAISDITSLQTTLDNKVVKGNNSTLGSTNFGLQTSTGTISFTTTSGAISLGTVSGGIHLACFESELMLDGTDVLLNGGGIKFNSHALNTANGLVQLDSSGKIPTSLYDATIDLSDYQSGEAIKLTATGGPSDGKGNIELTTSEYIKLKCSNSSDSITMGYSTMRITGETGAFLSAPSTVALEQGGRSVVESASGHLSLYSGFDLSITAPDGIKLNGAALNAANGLVQLGSDGKIPSNLYDAGESINLANYNTDGSINLTATGGMTFNTLTTSLVMNGTSIAFSTVQPLSSLVLNNNVPNTAGGFAIVGSDGKLPSTILPESTGGDTTQLESRVSALEGTVGTLDAAVDEILADYGEGSGALVYRVVASATEPENPTEGMIWIQTA